MRRVFLLLVVALTFSITALAQVGGASTVSSPGVSPAAKTSQSSTTKTSQLTGCLAKAPVGPGYVLTNGNFKKGVAVQSKEDISAHVGHTVMLTGTWQKPTAGAAGGAGAKGDTMRTFEAASLKHISPSCPAKAATTTKSTKTAQTTTDTKSTK